MRQVFLDKGVIAVKQVAEPLLDDHCVLVLVYYSFISSGTESATIQQAKESLFSNVPFKVKKVLQAVRVHGTQGALALIKGKLKGDVQTLGYSCSGQVIAAGSKVKHIHVGDWVACAGAGYANHADLVTVPEQLVVRVCDERFLKDASITTLGAIALQGIRQASLTLGETVCVVGLGLLGQLTVQLAKKSGCTVIGIDLVTDRIKMAAQLGADVVYAADDANTEQSIAFLTGHHGVDATIITASSASNELMNQAMRMTRKRGRIVIVGDVGLSISRESWYKKEIDVRIACSYGPGRYDPDYEQKGLDYPYAYVRWTQNRNMQAFVHMIETGALRINPLISQEVTLDTIDQGYESIKQRVALGIILNYHLSRSTKIASQYLPAKKYLEEKKSFKPPIKHKTRIGFVGVGGFAKIKLLPLVSKLTQVVINGIADVDIANAINVGRTYGVAKVCTLDEELFVSDEIDAVVIASPHKYHADQALKALRAGKAVFLEKPMATTFAQLMQFRALLQQYPNAPLCVDYNRSFSPFMQKIKRALMQRTTPIMVLYRINAGFIARDHWIQTELGAGRIIGEACHIVDLFCFLTDSKPVSISVESLHAQRDDLFPTDNFCTQIRFADGSVCSLLYTALGHAHVGKEYMELYVEGKTIIVDDYMKLEGHGLPSSFNEATPMQEKGHAQLLRAFFDSIRDPYFLPPISIERLEMVAEITLIIDQLACAGGGTREWHV